MDLNDADGDVEVLKFSDLYRGAIVVSTSGGIVRPRIGWRNV